jgi:hypothetical protein
MRAREFTINIPINIKINGDGEPEVSTSDEEQNDGDLGKFVPPLQQKIELLKKSAGVDNVFDQEASDDEPFE